MQSGVVNDSVKICNVDYNILNAADGNNLEELINCLRHRINFVLETSEQVITFENEMIDLIEKLTALKLHAIDRYSSSIHG